MEPNGVAWLLRNQELYDPNANYSRVWYQQVNQTGAKEGKEASWVFYTYAFPDCEQVGLGIEDPYEVSPWFETSCQTGPDGQCRTTPKPIRSFGINRSDKYNVNHDGCEMWAKLGNADKLGKGVGKLVVAAAGMVTAWLVAL